MQSFCFQCLWGEKKISCKRSGSLLRSWTHGPLGAAQTLSVVGVRYLYSAFLCTTLWHMLQGCFCGLPVTHAAMLTILESRFCQHTASVCHVENFLSISVLLLKALKVHLDPNWLDFGGQRLTSLWPITLIFFITLISLLKRSYTNNDQISQKCFLGWNDEEMFCIQNITVSFTHGGRYTSVIVMVHHNMYCIILSTLQQINIPIMKQPHGWIH